MMDYKLRVFMSKRREILNIIRAGMLEEKIQVMENKKRTKNWIKFIKILLTFKKQKFSFV